MDPITTTRTRSTSRSKLLVAGAVLAGVAGIVLATSIISGAGTFTGQSQDGEYLDLAAGYHTACVVKADTTVWCWGEQANFYNTAQVMPSRYPVQVKLPNGVPLTGVVSLSIGAKQGGPYCVVKSDNTVWCWGKDQQASRDTAGTFTAVHPVMASASAQLTGVNKVSVGDNNSCATKLDNTAWCWGPEVAYYGGTYDRTKYYSSGVNYPTQIKSKGGTAPIQDVVEVAASNVYYAITNSKPIKKTWVWGDPALLKWISGGTAMPQVLPTEVPGGATAGSAYPSITQLSAAGSHACGVDADHKAVCWGGCDIVNGTMAPNCLTKASPIGPSGPNDSNAFTDVVYASAGSYIDCAARAGGLWCWGKTGSYTNQQVSGNTNPYTKTPQEILYNGGSIAGVTKVAVGDNFSCALKMKRSILCWGDNRSYQLGTSQPDGTPGSNQPAIFPSVP